MPVKSMHNHGNLTVNGCQPAYSTCFGSMGVDDVGLELADQFFNFSIGAVIGSEADAPLELLQHAGL